MQFNLIDAAVHTRDGEAGRIWKVAMEPTTRKVTHLIVHKGVLFGRNVVVPIERVTRMAEGEVWLDASNDDLKGMADYEETEFTDPTEAWEYPVAFPMGGIIWPLQPGWGGANPMLLAGTHVKENIPDEDVALMSGTSVEATDGHVGRIDRVLVDDHTNEMTGFVIRKGFLFTRDVSAPMSWIDHVDKDAVHLKLTKQQVAEMAEHFDR
jgi:uncharacterized protein YrrD